MSFFVSLPLSKIIELNDSYANKFVNEKDRNLLHYSTIDNKNNIL